MKKSKKVMQMIVKNSKNIFKKKIDESKTVNIIYNRKNAIKDKIETK
jgi:hypothetical protein